MQIINKPLLIEFSKQRICEWCLKKFKATDPAHIFSRGAGRVDIRANLCSLCRKCHHDSHAEGIPSRENMLDIASKREGVPVDKIQDAIWLIRRLPKRTRIDDVAKMDGIHDLVKKMAIEAIKSIQ